MLNKIEALRKEPKSVRNRYAFGVALTATMVIALIWTISLPSRVSNLSVEGESADDTGGSFTESISEITSLVSESISQIQSQAELIESAGQATSSPATTSVDVAVTATSTPITASSSIQN